MRSVKFLVLLSAFLLCLVLCSCSTLQETLFPSGDVVRTVDGTNFIAKGHVVGPAIKAVGETARVFGPYGELVAGAIALTAAGVAKWLSDRKLAKHIEAEHKAREGQA